MKRPGIAHIVLAIALFGGGRAAVAEPILVCISDISYPPFIFSDRDGTIQLLLKQAAIRAKLPVVLVPMPVKRCIAELAIGKVAARIAGVNAETRQALRFPMRDGVIDAERALGVAREMAFKLKGSKVEWDGQRFSRISRPILLQPGFPATEALLKALNVPTDSGGKTFGTNLEKLLANRGEVVIGFESSADTVMARAEFAGKFEMLPIPVHSATYYLAFTRDYYQSHPIQVERLWEAILETRRSPEFEVARQAAHNYER